MNLMLFYKMASLPFNVPSRDQAWSSGRSCSGRMVDYSLSVSKCVIDYT